ncbi:hypothetical protein CTZ27_06860 [Streptomyces griseocarneus]|nr:hypothetical protein CTZ27_06860 [Streptomyces griseocarneus]
MRGLGGLIRRFLRLTRRDVVTLEEPISHERAQEPVPLPFRGLAEAPPVPHTGGPPAWPTREECGICDRYRAAIGEAGEFGYPAHAATYRTAWERHCAQIPHREMAV